MADKRITIIRMEAMDLTTRTVLMNTNSQQAVIEDSDDIDIIYTNLSYQ